MMSMIEQGEKKNGSDCPCKHVPLHLSSFTAAEQGNLSALRLRLSRHEQQQQQPTYDSAGNTPLHYAAQHGHTELVALLLNTGAYNKMYNNSNCSSSEKDIYKVSGVTPLHRACFSGATSSVRLLLDHQMTMMNSNQNNSNSNSSSNTLHFLSLPDISFNDYQTPLHKCAASGRYLVVQYLLDFIFQHDYSSIHSTTSSGSSDYNSGAEVSTMVVNARQLLRIKDARGRTPLDVARDKQHLPNRHAERQSVQRWDTIAGGCADWDICVQLLTAAQSKVERSNPIPVATSVVPYPTLSSEQEQLLLGPVPLLFFAPKVNGTDQTICNGVNCGDHHRQYITSSWEKSFQAALMNAVKANTTTTEVAASLNHCDGDDDDVNVETGKVPVPTTDSMSRTAKMDVQQHEEQVTKTSVAIPNRKSLPAMEQGGTIGRPCSDCGILCVVLTIIQSRNSHQKRLVCTKCRRRL